MQALLEADPLALRRPHGFAAFGVRPQNP
jgi:hypothetical protein